VDAGFDTENVLTFALALPSATFPDSMTQRPFWSTLLAAIEALPGVTAAGSISCLPLGCHTGNFLEVEGAPPRAADQPDPVILSRVASHGYFDAMGIELAAGRFYDATDDRPGAPRSIVVNETFARHFWPNDPDPVGRRVRGRGQETPWWTVVGVARDVRHYGLDTPMRPGIYVPANQMPERMSRFSIAVKAEADPLSLVGPIREAVRALDPTLPLAAVGTMEESLRRSLVLRETYSWALAVFAGLALLLAVGGIYGVTSYVVTQRTREIGIRIALGARTAAVIGSIVRRGMGAVVLGVALGLAASYAAARAMAGLLVGIDPADAVVYSGVAAVLLLTALAAHGLPARRAARTDPMRSLNAE
jgi:predicted permease